MSGNQAIAYAAAAVVGIALAVFTGGTALAAYSTLIGTIAFGATAAGVSYALADKGGQRQAARGFSKSGQSLSKPSSGTGRDSTAQQLNIAAASEAVVIPVVFGTVRMAGNIVHYDKSSFYSEPIIERRVVSQGSAPSNAQLKEQYSAEEYNRLSQKDSGGGKGGGGGGDNRRQYENRADRIARERVREFNDSGARARAEQTVYEDVIVGFKYFLSFDYGLCMGPIDFINQVQMEPGEIFIHGYHLAQPYTTVMVIDAAGAAGRVRVYQGDKDQARVATEPYSNPNNNYRHVCFANFQNFFIGNSPTPPTYVFDVSRLPKPKYDDGTAVAMANRGSDDPANVNYVSANPAAVVWEVLTDKVWGKGVKSDLLDVESFISVANYFAENNVGLDFSLDSQDTLESILDSIRLHTDLAIIWDGEKVRIRALSDWATAFTPLVDITSDMVVDPQVARPSARKATNEIRAEFTNRFNNYQPEIVSAQNDASVAIIKQINSQKIALSAFGNRENCLKTATRLLRDASNPPAAITFKMNRMQSRLLPGDAFRFIWTEWTTGTLISHWRVVSISDENQAADGFDVRAVEMQLAAYEVEGEIPGLVLPVNASEVYQPPGDADLILAGDNSTPLEAGAFGPVLFRELNIFLSGGAAEFAFLGDRENPLANGFLIEFQRVLDTQYFAHGFQPFFAITGALVDALPEGQRDLCRQDGDKFAVSLDYFDGRSAEILANASKCAIPADGLENITFSHTDLLLIGTEIIAVGNSELVGQTIVFSNYIRGYFGTRRSAHPVGTKFAYLDEWAHQRYAHTNPDFPKTGEDIDFRYSLSATNGIDDASAISVTEKFYGYGQRPFPPTLFSAGFTGNVLNLSVRPRFHDRGWEVSAEADYSLAEINSGMGDYTMQYQGWDTVTDAPVGNVVAMPGAYIADDSDDPATGLWAGDIPEIVGADEIRIYQAYAEVISAESVKIATPY